MSGPCIFTFKAKIRLVGGGKTVICHPAYQGLKSLPQPGSVTQSLGITPMGKESDSRLLRPAGVHR